LLLSFARNYATYTFPKDVLIILMVKGKGKGKGKCIGKGKSEGKVVPVFF